MNLSKMRELPMAQMMASESSPNAAKMRRFLLAVSGSGIRWLGKIRVRNFEWHGGCNPPPRSLLRDVGFEGHGAFVLAGFGGAAGLLVEGFLGAEGLFAFGGNDRGGAAVAEDAPGIAVVVEIGFENFNEAAFDRFFLDGDHQLDAFFEISRHPVGGGDEDQGVAALVEIEEAGVLEVAVDDGKNLNIFREFLPGDKAADAADVELDLDAGL